MMTAVEIKAELAQLNLQIAAEPKNYAEALQRRQALRRRGNLDAELSRMKRLSDLPEAFREDLRRRLSALDDQEFDRLLKKDASALEQLLPQGKG